MTLNKPAKVFIFILFLTIFSLYIALPAKVGNFSIPRINFKIGSFDLSKEIELKQGLDIKGGVQVILKADMSTLKAEDRAQALESLKTVLSEIVEGVFGKDTEYKFLDDTFPYTDPSLQIEVKINDQWVEIMGGGMPKKSVLKKVGIEGYNGWAFGFG